MGGNTYLSKDGKYFAINGKVLRYPIQPPTMADGNSWYKGSLSRYDITEIRLLNNYTPVGTVTEQWNADEYNTGSIKCYIEGTKLTIAGDGSGKIMANKDSSCMFAYFNQATSILGLSILDTSKTINMFGMFYACWQPVTLDISNFDTSNVENMEGMFEDCYHLTTPDLSNFNTSNVVNMSFMFASSMDSSLVKLDLSSFDVSKVINMSYIFGGCNSLKTLNLSNFDTSNVTNMKGVFSGCNQLTTVYVSDLWSTSKVTSSEYMFYDCESIVGATQYDSTKIDASTANYTTGYLTYKAN